MFWGKLPPLVEKLRVAVKAWRDGGYRDVSQTTAALLDWWFGSARLQGDWMHDSFRYYFAQREAIETIIYLYEAKRVKDKFDLMRFDSSGAITPGQFDEDWLRFLLIAPNIIVLDRLKKDLTVCGFFTPTQCCRRTAMRAATGGTIFN